MSAGRDEPVAEIITPAPQEWFVVVPSYDEAGNPDGGLYRIEVIAWLVQLYRRRTDDATFVAVSPVTVQGSIDDVEDYALQRGDRPPFYTVHQDFDDEAALLAYFKKSKRGGV